MSDKSRGYLISYLGLFLNGLCEDIHIQIFLKDAIDIFEIMDLVSVFEGWLLVKKGEQILHNNRGDRLR